jgi:catechol 2,3-dioxygenase-like lactoylglutathione lyase family enzyme
MFKETKAFSGFSVDDLAKAQDFYANTLGLDVTVLVEGELMQLNLAGGVNVLAYAKENHVPATFTILNFPVTDVEDAVQKLAAKGVTFERYDGMDQDDLGICREPGPVIAWFKDPAGNILSVLDQP